MDDSRNTFGVANDPFFPNVNLLRKAIYEVAVWSMTEQIPVLIRWYRHLTEAEPEPFDTFTAIRRHEYVWRIDDSALAAYTSVAGILRRHRHFPNLMRDAWNLYVLRSIHDC